jgi:predicted Zn-dependent protease with MMP-like domain
MHPAFSTPPSLDDIEALARWALAAIPSEFRACAANLVIRVEEFVDEETEEEMGLESPYELLGLYRGVSLNDKSFAVSSQDVDMVFLYRRPILDFWCETGEDLAHLVRHILIHEIGHHFGMSDEDMEAIEEQP